MITTRFSQRAKYLQLERREVVESVCVARIHRQSSFDWSESLGVLIGGGMNGERALKPGSDVVLLMVVEDGQSGDGRKLWKTESSLCWLGKGVNLVCHYCDLVMQKKSHWSLVPTRGSE
jgi:hypothetical protein